MCRVSCACLLIGLYIQLISASIPLDSGIKPRMAEKKNDTSVKSDEFPYEVDEDKLFACRPNDAQGSSMNDFPEDLFTGEERANGAVVLHLLAAVYSFAVIGIVCEIYFLPSVDGICCALNLSQDVAAATFMSFATAAPEFFTVLVGTFITQTDIGIGAVVGSGTFNVLGVATCGGLAARKTIKLDWWPLYRDSVTYLVAVAALIYTIWDRVVTIGESILLMAIFGGYFIIILFNQRLQGVAKSLAARWFEKEVTPMSEDTSTTSVPTISVCIDNHDEKPLENCTEEIKEENLGGEDYTPCFSNIDTRRSSRLSCRSDRSRTTTDVQPLSVDLFFEKLGRKPSAPHVQPQTESQKLPQVQEIVRERDDQVATTTDTPAECKEEELAEEEGVHLLSWPDGSMMYRTYWFVMWPVSCLLFCTVPDCRRKKFAKFYPLTFVMCIIWIGAVSYFASWMITVFGDTLGLPDSVMGLTFLAFGSAMPEAISCIILARQGIGGMGFSNALGCNTLDICLTMGVPWFIRIVTTSEKVILQSYSLHINSFLLIAAVVALLLINLGCHFKLNHRMGIYCMIVYLILVTLSILIELGVIVKVPYIPC